MIQRIEDLFRISYYKFHLIDNDKKHYVRAYSWMDFNKCVISLIIKVSQQSDEQILHLHITRDEYSKD